MNVYGALVLLNDVNLYCVTFAEKSQGSNLVNSLIKQFFIQRRFRVNSPRQKCLGHPLPVS